MSDPRIEALAEAARRELGGAVSPEDHERGRARALEAFATRAGTGARARPTAAWLAAAALALIIAAGVIVAWPRAPLRFTVDGAVVASGYVHAPPGGEGGTVRFSDGSEIRFTPGASGRIAEVGPHGARVLLESGHASFRVAHLPGARWSVEAGPYVIAVIGTVFEAAWSGPDQGLEVRLHEGAVNVRGPLAPDGIDLRAGQVLRVMDGELRLGEPQASALPLPPPTVEPRASALPPPPPAIPTATAPSAAPPPAHVPPAWPARVASGDFAGVLAEARAMGLESALRRVPLADLVALADASRYAREPGIARRALAAERERFPTSAEAHAAAFLLGRLADDAGSPAEAVRFYDRYLVEAPQGAFAAEALGRKMTALHRAGDAAALAAAQEYLRLYPKGPYAAAAREISPP